MNTLHKQRLIYLSLFLAGLALSAGLILYALKQNMNVFLTPSQLDKAALSPDYHFRLGGMVKQNSVTREKGSLAVQFVVTDLKRDLTVRYTGVLPDLFREGKGVVTEGHLNTNGEFIATLVLAKHDENYMPKQVYEKLRKNSA